jgi:hypothetical protein
MKKKSLLLTAAATLGLTAATIAQTSINLIPQDTLSYCNQDDVNIDIPGSYNLVTWKKSGTNGLIINDQLTIFESGFYNVYAADSTLGDTTICFSTSDTSMSTLVNVPLGYIITDVIVGYYGTPITDCNNPLPGSCHFDVTSIIKMGLVGKKSFQYFQGYHPDFCTGVVKSLYVKLRCMKYIEDSVFFNLIKKPFNYNQIMDTSVCSNSTVSFALPELTCDTNYIPFDTINLSITSNNDVNSLPTETGRLYKIKVLNAVSYGGGAGNQADGAYINITESPIEYITWRLNGMQYGTLSDFRPIPNGYNPSHEYNFYIIGNGGPFVFRANDCCLGDNSGQFEFIISEVVINQQCNLNYLWSNGNTGNTSNLSPSNNPYLIYLSNGLNNCPIDTININAISTINTQPQSQNANINNNILFTVTSSGNASNQSYNWQSDLGQGFQTLYDYGSYSGTNSSTLSIENVQLQNHNQVFRVISSSGECIDTSNVATISILDTCVTSINDTTFITVTDTLVINTLITGINPPNNSNTIKVYPNPANNHITIEYGDFAIMNGYQLRIENSLGQEVFQTSITQESDYLNLNTWGGNGLYFVHIVDPQGNTIDIRKIVLQ